MKEQEEQYSAIVPVQDGLRILARLITRRISKDFIEVVSKKAESMSIEGSKNE